MEGAEEELAGLERPEWARGLARTGERPSRKAWRGKANDES
jgi:hypothetical protein